MKDGCIDLDEMLSKIAKLEKENAELKDDSKIMADNYSKMEQKFYDNLTKAKEIIKNLLFFLNKFYSEDWPVCMDEAQQFIKDNEVEK